jgi:hypothetical protein
MKLEIINIPQTFVPAFWDFEEEKTSEMNIIGKR